MTERAMMGLLSLSALLALHGLEAPELTAMSSVLTIVCKYGIEPDSKVPCPAAQAIVLAARPTNSSKVPVKHSPAHSFSSEQYVWIN
jgi:hypothetical protein